MELEIGGSYATLERLEKKASRDDLGPNEGECEFVASDCHSATLWTTRDEGVSPARAAASASSIA